MADSLWVGTIRYEATLYADSSELPTRPVSNLSEISLNFIAPALAQRRALRTIKDLLASL
jgi:hypothetical protein